MCPGVVQVRELEVQEEAKDREVGLSHRDRGFRTREEAVFPAHTTRFWVLVGPPQGTRAETGSIRPMQKARESHLPRTVQLRRFGAIGPDTRLARAKMSLSQTCWFSKQFSFHFLNK